MNQDLALASPHELADRDTDFKDEDQPNTFMNTLTGSNNPFSTYGNLKTFTTCGTNTEHSSDEANIEKTRELTKI